MQFKTTTAVESVVFQMVYAEWARATNRAAINQLFNGLPPYSQREATQNNLEVNVNDLTATNIAMTARGQLTNALVTPNPLVDITIDHGPVWKRREWEMKVAKEFNKIIKNSLPWQEEEESTFANLVLHGIAPALWHSQERWVPKAKMVEDVLVPGRTNRSLDNLQMFAVRERYTGMELRKMTSGPDVDPAWNMPMVEGLIKWVDAETRRLMGNYWPETWQPESWQERFKEDGGFYTGDDVPTVDCFHFYFWNDTNGVQGWNKRIILDTWGNPGLSGGWNIQKRPRDKYSKGVKVDRNDFLYDPGDRKYANNHSEIMHWQFGDVSAVAPFRYHTTRGLGFMLYAVCHLLNRLKCRVSEAAFESLLQYFRVTNPDDQERAVKVDLINRGVIPDGINFMPQNERWQTNESMANAAMAMYQQTIQANSASYTQGSELGKENKEETATAVMARVNSVNQLISAMIGRTYNYQVFKLREIARRFCIRNSGDPDVMQFRNECLKSGVPAEALNFERWTVTPVRVIGGGNKLMQMAMADKLMATIYDKIDPTEQADLKRLYIAVNSGDYDLANRMVPEMPVISPTVNAAQNDAATLLLGMPVSPRKGINETEYIETMLHSMAAKVAQLEMAGAMATSQEIQGLAMMAQTIEGHIKVFAQDKKQKAQVKKYSDDLGKLMNLLKSYAQRLAEQNKSQNGMTPEAQAKVQTMLIQAQTKSKIQSESHAQRTAERKLAFEQKMRQDMVQHRADLVKKDLESASSIRRNGLKAFTE